MMHDSRRDYLRLGAPLYVPATRSDLAEIANGQRFGTLRSLIVCTEDAVAASQLPLALDNLRQMLTELQTAETLRFIRVRNPSVLACLLDMPGIQQLNGFVLPKSTYHNLQEYLDLLPADHNYWLMPTLETIDALDPVEMRRFRTVLEESPFRSKILALRIGGNDLLHLLGLRRRPNSTIYDTPLHSTFSMLATVFLPADFYLTAPVFEGLNDEATLARELACDLDHGFYSKAAVHPDQVRWIESRYAVSHEDLLLAEAILDESAPAVFRMQDVMCEPATHHRWATMIVERNKSFGTQPHAVRKNGHRRASKIQTT